MLFSYGSTCRNLSTHSETNNETNYVTQTIISAEFISHKIPALSTSLVQYQGGKKKKSKSYRESANVKKRVQPAVDAHAYTKDLNICKGSQANKSESSAEINYLNPGDAPPAIANSLIEFSIDGFKKCVNTDEVN
ncbi:MAG: hypothetical protein EZS28_002466 [Streblomastix strix]|uniref:Uncharacterized protein n=1 Tax=Streblomastix strix TaxID=222440 RepID=A0A5J4X3V8_9EUKA|nr:MAG: hypothetical protein EZS28_002466 [Streblomastix strix]